MNKPDLEQEANNNLLALKKNLYPGRGIIVGMNKTEEFLIQVYWITGRSDKSRNRILISDEFPWTLKTVLANPNLQKEDDDLSLVIYTAMDERKGNYAVSNGHQTANALLNNMEKWRYESDHPNCTPRITAVIYLARPYFTKMSILKKSPTSYECDRYLYELALSPGLGYCITTYSGDGNPLPPFKGDPYLLPLSGSIGDIANTIWGALNEENRVSLAVKFINVYTGQSVINIINKYSAV
jgi:hypothetical protein